MLEPPAAPMPFTEETTQFDCDGDALFGILARPSQPARVGVVVIVGGPQTRVGSHRQFVLLSRALAASGFAVLRFDYRGMGDSEGAARDFLAVSADIGHAITALQTQVPEVQQVALWGLCDGASAALLYLHQTQDARVGGLCLLNPWVRSEASLARTQIKHYYTQRLMQKEFWLKLASGKVAASAVKSVITSLKAAFSQPSAQTDEANPLPFQQKMASAWLAFGGTILLVLSGDDYTAKEFLDYSATDSSWKQAMSQPSLDCQHLANADHTLSDQSARLETERLTLTYIMEMSASVAPLKEQ
jgi:uncharacterized protein